MVSTKQLEESSILGLIIKFSGPAVTGLVVMSIYNIVDRIYIGRDAGALGIAGIAVGYPMVMVRAALTLLVGVGAAALISIRLGEGKKEEAERVMGSATTLLVVLALASSVLSLLFLEPLMRLFGASENVLPYAMQYMTIIAAGNIFHMISFGANNFIRAEGNPRTAMFTMLIGALLNAILDPIFIFVLGLGVAGAAMATVISQAISATWVLAYFLRGKSLLQFRIHSLKPDFQLTRTIMSMGMASFFKQVASSLIMIILNNSLLHYGGDIAVSAMGVIFSIMTLLMMPVFGISQGVQPIIGYNYGARNFDRVKQALFFAILLTTGIVVVGFLAIVSFPEFFIRLFSDEPELITVGAKGLRTYLLFLPVLGFQVIGANYFQAVGRPNQAVLQNLTRQVVFMIPALFILPRVFGLTGVWSAQPTADALSVAVTAVFVWRELRYLDHKQAMLTVNT